MKRLNVISFILLCSVSIKIHAAQIHLDKEMDHIPSFVSEIKSVGYWKKGTQEGYYKIIYVEDYYGSSLLYIQWILNASENNNLPSTLKTVSIKEFNEDDHIGLSFKMPQIQLKKQGMILSVLAQNSHDNKAYSYFIKVGNELGEYTIKKQLKINKNDSVK